MKWVCQHPDSYDAGFAFLVHKDVVHEVVFKPRHAEAVGIRIRGVEGLGGRDLFVLGMHVHPCGNDAQLAKLLKEWEEVCLQKNDGVEPPMMMMGDPNARLGRSAEGGWCTTTNGHGRVMRTVVEDRDLVVGNEEEPTCYTWNGSSNIDLVVCNRECESAVGRTWVGEDIGSDHRPVLVEMIWDLEGPAATKRETFEWEGADWEGLKDFMHIKGKELGERRCWPEEWEALTKAELVGAQAKWFTEATQDAIAAHVPTKTVSRKRGQPFWWTEEAEEGRRERQQLHNEWRRCCVLHGHRSVQAGKVRRVYLRTKDEVEAMHAKAREDSWASFCDGFQGDPKQT